MKYIPVIILALALPVGLCQSPTSEKVQLQEAKVQLALKDYQLAQSSVGQAQQNLQMAQANVLTQVAQAKKELGYGDDWDFNFDTGVFVKKSAKPAPPPTGVNGIVSPAAKK